MLTASTVTLAEFPIMRWSCALFSCDVVEGHSPLVNWERYARLKCMNVISAVHLRPHVYVGYWTLLLHAFASSCKTPLKSTARIV